MYNKYKESTYLKQFNCVQTNDQYQIELFVFHRNTWNCLSECKRINFGLVRLYDISTIVGYLLPNSVLYK